MQEPRSYRRTPEENEEGALLRAALGTHSPLLPFAEAVVRHLSTTSHAGESPVRIAELLLGIVDPVTSSDRAIDDLARSPAMLASFFQNADLLAPGSPEATRVAGLVLGAMDLLEPPSR
jgi:hypothetical protein